MMTETNANKNDERLRQMKEALESAWQGNAKARENLLILASSIIRERAEYLMSRKFRFLSNRGHDIDSVVNDVWLKLHKNFEEKLPNSLEHLLALLALSVHHKVLDKIRSLRTRDENHEQIGLDSTPPYAQPESDRDSYDPQVLAEMTEFQQQLWAKLNRLEEDERRVFEMHYFLGITQARIAQDLQIHPKRVSRLWIKASGQLVMGWKEETRGE